MSPQPESSDLNCAILTTEPRLQTMGRDSPDFEAVVKWTTAPKWIISKKDSPQTHDWPVRDPLITKLMISMVMFKVSFHSEVSENMVSLPYN